MGYRLVHVLGVLEFRIFIDALLDKYLFKGGEEQGLLLLLFLDLYILGGIIVYLLDLDLSFIVRF